MFRAPRRDHSKLQTTAAQRRVLRQRRVALIKVSHRIEIQLTSKRPDGFWTWRAAGAREPKGDVHGELLEPGVKVGDVLRVEVEMGVDGMKIREVLGGKAPRKRKAPSVIDHIGSGDFKVGVLVPEGMEDSGSGGSRRKRSEKGRPRKGARDRRGEGWGEHSRSGKGNSSPQWNRDKAGGGGGRSRQQAPRLRPGKKHVSAWLATLSAEDAELGKKLVDQGVRAVREETFAAKASEDGATAAGGGAGAEEQSSEAARKKASEENKRALAEQAAAFDELSDAYLSARWRDRAEAASSLGSKLELRDLRSVVADDFRAAPEEKSQKLAAELRKRLTERLEREHAAWLADLGSAITSRRAVAALRLSARSPKVGVPLPELLSEKLCELASSVLDADESEDTWEAVLETAASSPIRLVLRPESLPAEPSKKLSEAVRKFGDRLPLIAAEFAEVEEVEEAAAGEAEEAAADEAGEAEAGEAHMEGSAHSEG